MNVERILKIFEERAIRFNQKYIDHNPKVSIFVGGDIDLKKLNKMWDLDINLRDVDAIFRFYYKEDGTSYKIFYVFNFDENLYSKVTFIKDEYDSVTSMINYNIKDEFDILLDDLNEITGYYL